MNKRGQITPMPMPVNIPGSSEPEKIECPKCGHSFELENDKSYTLLEVLIALSVVIAIVWILLILITWLVTGDPLFQVLKNQWEWLTSIRLW